MSRDHELKTRKIFDKNNYIRMANAQNHWVDFSYLKMRKFVNDFDEDFNIVIYWHDQETMKSS